ncbi:MAG: HEPN domain-containing protein [Candidatus Bathyarchaeia archaeon]
MLDEDEYERWMRASKEALVSAKGDLERGDYNWTCFKAQQAAEFAARALLHGLGLPAYGHSLSKLLEAAPKEFGFQQVERQAKTLDKYYVPTRYPNAWVEGTPKDYYTREDGEEALRCAEDIACWVEASWRSLRRGGN